MPTPFSFRSLLPNSTYYSLPNSCLISSRTFSMCFLWLFYGFLWDFYGFSMGFLWIVHFDPSQDSYWLLLWGDLGRKNCGAWRNNVTWRDNSLRYSDLMGFYSDLMGLYSTISWKLIVIYSDLRGFYSDLMGSCWDISSGKHTKWPFSIAFCMFTRGQMLL